MQQAMNVPYVKEFDSNGKLLNPIKGSYMNNHPNRKQRRQKVKTPKLKIKVRKRNGIIKKIVRLLSGIRI